ncbi:MAG: hypothetical protein M1834_002412 [Cirrosporium novae-zelandiae]|nr:MAG: hypothetical protein M1834_002412 [Cirrosporium novae-zelandiae]
MSSLKSFDRSIISKEMRMKDILYESSGLEYEAEVAKAVEMKDMAKVVQDTEALVKLEGEVHYYGDNSDSDYGNEDNNDKWTKISASNVPETDKNTKIPILEETHLNRIEYTLDKLKTSTGYSRWSLRMTLYLKAELLWEYIDGTYTKAYELPEIEDFPMKNEVQIRQAYGMTLSDPITPDQLKALAKDDQERRWERKKDDLHVLQLQNDQRLALALVRIIQNVEGQQPQQAGRQRRELASASNSVGSASQENGSRRLLVRFNGVVRTGACVHPSGRRLEFTHSNNGTKTRSLQQEIDTAKKQQEEVAANIKKRREESDCQKKIIERDLAKCGLKAPWAADTDAAEMRLEDCLYG